MTAQFQFVMRSGPTPGKVFPLEGPEIIIGRDNTSSMMINDAEVSRKHTRLVWQSLGYVIEDLGSTNGTFIDGQRLTAPYVLRGGETVTLGENIVLVYESTADPDATVLTTSASAVKQAIAEAQAKAETPKPEVPRTPTPSQPVSTPVPPAPSRPAPFSSTSGQPVAPKKSRKSMVILLVIVLGLLCICGFIAIYLYRAPISFWCDNLSFYFKPELYPQCVP
jgi:predicted component of type VI protein secretion system